MTPMRPVPPAVVLLVAALAGGLAGCGDRGLLIFGAASLADALDEAQHVWASARPDEPVLFNFAASNDLARQIAAGAPADLFISANRTQLEAAERAVTDEAVALLANTLVVIAPAARPGVAAPPGLDSPADLLGFDRLALPDPEAVPAGIYARRWLESEGLWTALEDRVVPAIDVRANLAAVASGALSVGVVYATDAAVSDRVEVIHRVSGGPRIVYWAAPVEGGDRGGARELLAWLESSEAEAIVRRHGFEHLPRGARQDGDAGDGTP